jgi:hypothetical protein
MKRISTIVPVLVMVLSLGARAQVQLGETSLGLNGNLQVGYDDEFSNVAGSDHNFQIAGLADLTGSYYDPKFISFSIQPFFNQSRANSDFQSITSSSGVGASVNIFSGSRFPGSVTYTRTFNGTGNYAIPGIANYNTHQDAQQFGVNWGEQIEGLPSLNVSFNDASAAYSLYGLSTEGTNHSDLVSVISTYRAAGFLLNGQYQYTNIQTNTPQIANTEALQSSAAGNSFSFGASHNLPFQGSFGASFSRTSINSSYDGYNYDATIDTIGTGVSFLPVKNLAVGVNAFYTDNFEGTIYNSLVNAGAIVSGGETGQSSNALDVNSYANYDVPSWFLHLRAGATFQQQTYLGRSLSNYVFEQSATESRPLLGGFFSGTAGVTESIISGSNSNNIGLISSASYTRQMHRLSVSAAGSYSQNTQTILIGYTTSGYQVSGNVGYQLSNKSFWGASASLSQSLLTAQPGTANSAQTYSTSLSLPLVSFSASYSKSKGNALLTSTGLVPTPLPPTIIPPSELVLYNGTAYSVGIGAHPIQGLTISGSYAKALSGTVTDLTKSSNSTENLYFWLTYRFRKVELVAGYSKISQGFSITGTPPTTAGEMYIGISRWFNFF